MTRDEEVHHRRQRIEERTYAQHDQPDVDDLPRRGVGLAKAPDRRDGVINTLITDVAMPFMHGHELTETLQRARPATPVLYMSGYAAACPLTGGAL